MQPNQRTMSWHRPALVVSFAVFLVLIFTSSPSVSSIPTLSDLETAAIPAAPAHEPTAPAPVTGHDAQRAYLRTLPYGEAIVEASDRSGVDGLLIAAVVEMESGFAADAVSPRGAVGLMQIRPTGLPKGHVLTDPEANLEAGSRYLAGLLERYDGDLERSLAAYNAGPGMVDRWKGVPPFRETRSYVRRVQERYLGLHRRIWHADGDVISHPEVAEAIAAIAR